MRTYAADVCEGPKSGAACSIHNTNLLSSSSSLALSRGAHIPYIFPLMIGLAVSRVLLTLAPIIATSWFSDQPNDLRCYSSDYMGRIPKRVKVFDTRIDK